MSIDNSKITSRSVVLALSGCTGVGTGAGAYSVRYGFISGDELTVEIGTSNYWLEVTELRPQTQYTFTVSCVNSAGVTGPNVNEYATTLSEGLFVTTSINELQSITLVK